jgi:hypothetical protein
MTRNPKFDRLPNPPELKIGITNHDANVSALNNHLQLITRLLNQSTQDLHNAVNTIQQIGAHTPPNVSGLTVTGKQGLFHLTWNRVVNVDGYEVVQYSDAAMTQIINRWNLPDANTCAHQVPVGNVAVTNTFQVHAYQGNKIGDPSPGVTATTAVYASAEAAPVAPPIAPLPVKKSPPRSGPNL